MFDIGFSELFLIAIVALVVLGPERLPKAAAEIDAEVRSAGEEARREFDSMRAQIAHDGSRTDDADDATGPETTAVVAKEDPAQDDPQTRARDDGAGDDRR